MLKKFLHWITGTHLLRRKPPKSIVLKLQEEVLIFMSFFFALIICLSLIVFAALQVLLT